MAAPDLFSGADYCLVLGCARVSLWRLPAHEQEDIAQKVYLKLEAHLAAHPEKSRTGVFNLQFIKAALKSAEMDYYRECQRVVPLGDAEERVAASSDSMVEDEEKIRTASLAFIEHRLQMVFGQDHSPVHELVAYGKLEVLGQMPAAAVAEIAPLTVAQAAEAFVDEYQKTSRVATWRLRALFHRLLGLAGTPEGDTLVGDLLELGQVVQGWIDEVRERCGAPAEFLVDEFQSALRDIPNACVAWLLHDRLNMGVAEIVRRGSASTLGEMAEYFVDVYAQRTGKSDEEIVAELGGLDCGNSARRPLCRSGQAARAFEHWSFAVKRRLRSQYHRNEKTGLEKIIAAAAHPWGAICFLETLVLHNDAAEVLREGRTKTLDELVDGLENGRYADSWRGDRPTAGMVKKWFRPLRGRIAVDGLGTTTLGWLVENDQAFRGNGAAVISKWRSDVMLRIERLFGYDHPDTLLMAWRIGLLRQEGEPGVTPSGRD